MTVTGKLTGKTKNKVRCSVKQTPSTRDAVRMRLARRGTVVAYGRGAVRNGVAR